MPVFYPGSAGALFRRRAAVFFPYSGGDILPPDVIHRDGNPRRRFCQKRCGAKKQGLTPRDFERRP
jgi:hypothetical protein